MFLALAQSSSTRQAAERLGINASTISRKLTALEATLGVRLVERHPGGMRLTSAGNDVVDAAMQMNEFVRTLTRRVAGADRALVGTVRVSVPEVISHAVGEILASVIAEHRGLQVEFRVDDKIADLARHEADLAVRVSDTPPGELFGRKLGRAGVGVYASERYFASHPFDLTDQRHQWVEWPSYVRGKAAYQWLEQEVPARRVAVHASSAQAVQAAVAAGLGLSPMVHAHARRTPGLVSRWALPHECGTDVWALTHREVSRNARVRVVLKALAELEL